MMAEGLVFTGLTESRLLESSLMALVQESVEGDSAAKNVGTRRQVSWTQTIPKPLG